MKRKNLELSSSKLEKKFMVSCSKARPFQHDTLSVIYIIKKKFLGVLPLGKTLIKMQYRLYICIKKKIHQRSLSIKGQIQLLDELGPTATGAFATVY